MIVEHVHLSILPNQSFEFENAMQQAKHIVATMSGFQGLVLLKSKQREDAYILMIKWDSIEDHQLGFRQSAEYLHWKALLHHFYQPMPEVEYYETCMQVE